jgi:hypothetical protein
VIEGTAPLPLPLRLLLVFCARSLACFPFRIVSLRDDSVFKLSCLALCVLWSGATIEHGHQMREGRQRVHVRQFSQRQA